ncbi:MAG: FAD-dependent oxidoreductase [Pseudomonadota bacterium]
MPGDANADVCVIGAGSAGLSFAAGAAMLDRKVVLIEKGEMGGDCLNYGCVPSKALLAAGKAAHVARTAEKFGVSAGPVDVDFAAVMEHVAGVIASIAPHDSQERFEGLGVTVIRAPARFVSRTVVEAGGRKIRAKRFIVATGSAPFVPPIEGLADAPYFTNETLFANRERPDHLVIIGGGPIGVEMAQAHRRLGSAVTIVTMGTILPADDPEAVAVVRAALIAEGVAIRENARARRVDHAPANGGAERLSVTLDDGARIDGSHLLVAVGRRASVDGLGLEEAGVAFDEKGVKTDDRLRTTAKGIYAIGDAAGGPQFTHLAGDHAATLVRSILFKTPAKRNDAAVPHVTYCDPEIAAVGLSEARAREQFADVKPARFDYAENDRARAERRTEGFVKIITRKNGAILGAVVVGAGAGELLAPWVDAVATGRKVKDYTAYMAPYPTLSELNKRVAGAWYTDKVFSPAAKRLVGALGVFD